MLVEQPVGQSIQGDFRFEPPKLPKYGYVESLNSGESKHLAMAILNPYISVSQ